MKERYFKIFLLKIFLFGLILFTVSCHFDGNKNLNSDDIVQAKNPEETKDLQVSDEIVLGNKINNPFSIRTNRSIADEEPNYFYFKIRTTKLEGIDNIKQVCGDLNIIPCDYEVIQGGSSFNENLGDAEHSPWYYYVLPINVLDSFCSSEYEIEILDEMFISDEDIKLLSEPELLGNDNDNSLEDLDNSARFLWFNWKSVKPYGKVTVYDEVAQQDMPVPNVRVTITQWCFTHSVYTDSNGCYQFPVNYTTLLQNNALVTVWFENEHEDVMHSGFVSTSFYTQGHKNIAKLKDNTIKLANNTEAQKYGHIIRAAELYRGYANDYGVTNPKKLKIWADLNTSSDVTLMGSDVITPSAVYMSTYIGLVAGGPMASLISGATASLICSYIPNLVIGCKSVVYRGVRKTSTEVIYSVIFHEMAHASHFKGLGASAADYWTNEYIDMLLGWIKVIFNVEDPEKNCYNNGESQRVCFIESCFFFFGDYLMSVYYKDYIGDNYRSILEDPFEAEYSYIYNQAYYNMIQKGYLIKDIFGIYKKSYVISAKSFIDEFSKVQKLDTGKKEHLITLFKEKGAKL